MNIRKHTAMAIFLRWLLATNSAPWIPYGPC